VSRHARPRIGHPRFVKGAAAVGLLVLLGVVAVLHSPQRPSARRASIAAPALQLHDGTAGKPHPPLAVPPAPASGTVAPWASPATARAAGHLAPGSQPAALPTPILIVDKFNNRLIVVDPQGRIRWQFPQPGDLAAGQTFRIPDDAFFSPDGKEIVATQEDQQVITVIDVASRHIVYRYGVPGHSGAGANRLSNPDDAIMLPDGYLLSPDIKNCRIVLLSTRTHQPAQVIGTTTTNCRHAPPTHWGSPNGAFPMANGHYLITEINGDWVDSITLNGSVAWSTHPPGINYPSDTNEISADRYLSVDYSAPGQAVVFDRAGTTLWRYRPRGASALNHPSLALPLPNGNILITDDYNHRVIVVDPHTNQVLWQYGVRGAAGSTSGHLNNPDGLDLVPPNSLTVVHRSTMGLPTLSTR
jgi:hypothetical protein